MYINPGELDKKIEIVLISENGTDKDCLPIRTRKHIRTCPAKVSTDSGAEVRKSSSEFSETNVRFLIRWSPVEINTDMAVCYGGRDYDIEYVNSYGDSKEYTEIWTKSSERV